MRPETHPQPERHEEVEASDKWEMYSSMADELEGVVEPLVTGEDLLRETPTERSVRLERLIECKSLAEELRGHIVDEQMPVLNDKVGGIVKRIQAALDNKLH